MSSSPCSARARRIRRRSRTTSRSLLDGVNSASSRSPRALTKKIGTPPPVFASCNRAPIPNIRNLRSPFPRLRSPLPWSRERDRKRGYTSHEDERVEVGDGRVRAVRGGGPHRDGDAEPAGAAQRDEHAAHQRAGRLPRSGRGRHRRARRDRAGRGPRILDRLRDRRAAPTRPRVVAGPGPRPDRDSPAHLVAHPGHTASDHREGARLLHRRGDAAGEHLRRDLRRRGHARRQRAAIAPSERAS